MSGLDKLRAMVIEAKKMVLEMKKMEIEALELLEEIKRGETPEKE